MEHGSTAAPAKARVPAGSALHGEPAARTLRGVNLLRHLRPACIRLPLATLPLPVGDEETAAQTARRRADEKELVLREIAEVLDASGEVVNQSKLIRDLMYRETQTTTGIGNGIAMPHVRSLQVRSFVIGFANAQEPLWFEAIDGEPVDLFVLMAAPPYDDKVYHQAYKALAEVLSDEDSVAALRSAASEQDVFAAFRRHWR